MFLRQLAEKLAKKNHENYACDSSAQSTIIIQDS